MRPFWQPCWSARSVVVVEVNGYTIEPGADLRGAKLRGANLTAANLTNTNLTGTNLSGVRADGLSIWPDGFNPVDAGVIFV